MSVQSRPFPAAAPWWARYNRLHGAAVIAHGLSFATTLWFIQWVWPGGDIRAQGCVAYVLEFFLFGLKSVLLNGEVSDDGIGWVGVGADAVINAGGILLRAGDILTFPPFAVVLALVGMLINGLLGLLTLPPLPPDWVITTIQDVPITLGGLLFAIASGILLSAAPHRIWQAAKRG